MHYKQKENKYHTALCIPLCSYSAHSSAVLTKIFLLIIIHWLFFHIISVTQDILFVMISWRHCLASSTACTISILCICQCFVYIIYIAACISPHTFTAICTNSLLLLLLLFFAVEQVGNMRAYQFTHSHTWQINHLQFQYHTFSQWTSCEPHLLGVSETTHSLVSLCKLQALSSRVIFS